MLIIVSKSCSLLCWLLFTKHACHVCKIMLMCDTDTSKIYRENQIVNLGRTRDVNFGCPLFGQPCLQKWIWFYNLRFVQAFFDVFFFLISKWITKLKNVACIICCHTMLIAVRAFIIILQNELMWLDSL